MIPGRVRPVVDFPKSTKRFRRPLGPGLAIGHWSKLALLSVAQPPTSTGFVFRAIYTFGDTGLGWFDVGWWPISRNQIPNMKPLNLLTAVTLILSASSLADTVAEYSPGQSGTLFGIAGSTFQAGQSFVATKSGQLAEISILLMQGGTQPTSVFVWVTGG